MNNEKDRFRKIINTKEKINENQASNLFYLR